VLRDLRRGDRSAARHHLEEALALNPHDEDARRLLVGLDNELSDKDADRQPDRLRIPAAAPTVVDLSDREVADPLEAFLPEESPPSSVVASTAAGSATPARENPPDLVRQLRPDVARTAAGSARDRQSIADTIGPDVRTAVAPNAAAAAVAGVLSEPRRRFRPRLAWAGITLAALALIGLIEFIVIRVALSPHEAAQRPLLKSVGTLTIGHLVPVRAPLPIEPLAPADAASVIGSTQRQVVPPAEAAVEEPLRTVRTASERPATAAVIPPSSTSDSPTSTPAVPPAEPLAPPPAAVDPRLAPPEPLAKPEQRPAVAAAPISAEASGASTDTADIQDLLNRYQDAFNNLNAGAAKTLWPSVDERMLGRAFDQLKRQEVVLGACQTTVTGFRAVSSCHGHASYVPKVGNKMERNEARRWTFTLRKSEGGWLIERVESR
jgi:hypothetical protein